MAIRKEIAGRSGIIAESRGQGIDSVCRFLAGTGWTAPVSGVDFRRLLEGERSLAGAVQGLALIVVYIGSRKQARQRRVLFAARRLLLVIALLLPSIFTVAAGAADDKPAGFTAEEKQAFVAAVARDDAVTERALVVAAVASDSSRLSGIVRDVFELAPERAEAIVGQVGRVLPQLNDRLTDIVSDVRARSAKSKARDGTPSSEAVAVPKQPPAKALGAWSGETVLGGSYRSAAQSSATASARFKVAHDASVWRNSAEIEVDYGETNSVTIDQRLFLSGRSRRNLGERLYAFGIASYEDDRFSGFDYEVTEGVGLGYRLFDLDSFDLDIEGGPSLRQNRIAGTEEVNQEFLFRIATDLTWHISDSAKFTNKTALFFSRNSVEVTTDAYSELRDGAESTNTSALDLQIIGNLAARCSYEIHYRSDPPPDGVTTETTSKVSLVHSF